MTTTTRLTTGATVAALAIGLALGGTSATQAQTNQDHDAHHPSGATAPTTPTTPAPAPAQPPRGMPGMMGGQGMPMQGMSGGPQGGTSGMMGGDMGQMMQMMHRMRAAQAMMGGPGALRHFERIDAHLAYVRTALRITDAQTPQWNAFADAARAAADKLRQAYAQAMQTAGQRIAAPDLLERRIALLSAQLDATKSVAAPAKALHAALSDEQKRTADELLAEHLQDMRMLGL